MSNQSNLYRWMEYDAMRSIRLIPVWNEETNTSEISAQAVDEEEVIFEARGTDYPQAMAGLEAVARDHVV